MTIHFKSYVRGRFYDNPIATADFLAYYGVDPPICLLSWARIPVSVHPLAEVVGFANV